MTSAMQRLKGTTVGIVGSILVWWAFVILPGLLTVCGVFGPTGTEEGIDLGGALAGAWIGCYLVALALIYVVGYMVGHTRSWWFFVTSLLPWAVDWAAPTSVGVGLAAIAVAGGFASTMAILSLRSIALDTRGIQVDAEVVKVLRNYMNVVINNVYIRRRVLLRYSVPDVGQQETVLHMLCEIGTTPSAGDHFKLRVDPRNPKHIAIDPSEFSKS